MASETNPNFMNGVPELLIFRLLEQDEMYGYEIVQRRTVSDCRASHSNPEVRIHRLAYPVDRTHSRRSREKQAANPEASERLRLA